MSAPEPVPEFARPVRIDALGEGARPMTVEADAGERAALAARFGLVALDRLAAEAVLTRKGDMILAEGRVTARLTQACVASGTPLPAEIDEPFSLRFVPAVASGGDMAGEEMELDIEDVDTVEYAGGAIDLGEAVAETMALCLDPFPRARDADAVLREAGVLSEEEAAEAASPFAALKGKIT